jgi:GNAT superfamily N-acetyltransferase
MQIRVMHEGDLPTALRLSQQVKWPHRLEDWQQALKLGAGIVAEEAGQVIGTALGWRWGSDYATLGLVIVDPACQGRGIGKQLLLAVLENMPGYTVRLHATEAGRPLYEKLGFQVTGILQQHQCAALGQIAPEPLTAHQFLSLARPQDAALLTALDQRAHGQSRPALIAMLLAQAERVVMLKDQHGLPQGFAALRRFGRGLAIGPVIAHDLQQAKVLVSELLQPLAGEFVRIDSDPSLGLCDWLESQGLPVVDVPTVMVKGTPWIPAAGAPQAFGLMSQALG